MLPSMSPNGNRRVRCSYRGAVKLQRHAKTEPGAGELSCTSVTSALPGEGAGNAVNYAAERAMRRRIFRRAGRIANGPAVADEKRSDQPDINFMEVSYDLGNTWRYAGGN